MDSRRSYQSYIPELQGEVSGSICERDVDRGLISSEVRAIWVADDLFRSLSICFCICLNSTFNI